jgi:MATE family multidrug resistance protein
MKEYFSVSIKKIANIGFPTMLFFLSLYLQQTLCLAFIGKKYNNQDMINAIGIVDLYINCTLFCFSVGLLSGLDTLLSNSLSVNVYLFGLYIHRARLITYLFSIILCLFHYFYGLKLIKLFNIDEATLSHCEDFLHLSLVYVLVNIQFGVNFRVLSVLDKTGACVGILLIGIFLHPFWCYIMINLIGGLRAVGWALVISQVVSAILSSLYIYIYSPMPEGSYFSLNKDCFKGWGEYLKFTIPSTLMLCAEWLAFEVQSVFAIYASKEDYSVHIFLSNIATLMYTLCHGFGMAATVLIGEYIAKNMIKYAKAIALYCFVLSEITMSVIIVFIIIFRESVLSIFVDDTSLLEKGRPLIVVLAVGEIFDATQSVMASIYRGLGKQRQASIIAFVQFYFVQIFFSWLLVISFGLGVKGIWLSILLGNIITTVIYIYFFTKFDFGRINIETKERLEKDQKLITSGKE